MDNIIILFGATGDLANRYLLPAIHELNQTKYQTNPIHTILVGRRDWDTQDWQTYVQDSIGEDLCIKNFSYIQADITKGEDYQRITKRIDEIRDISTPENITFYLSVGPNFFEIITQHLKEQNLHTSKNGQRKIIIEKPFGRDLRSATILNIKIQEVFEEKNIYRIDHYLGKDFVHDLQAYRFSQGYDWGDHNIKSIEIYANESITVLDRGEYYDQSGALRDMIQNHLLQLLAISTMKCSENNHPEFIGDKKMQAIHDVSALLVDPRHDIILGQYDGYSDTKGVRKESKTETFVRIHLHIDNPIWKKTNIILQSGKGLDTKETSITYTFHDGTKKRFEQTPENKNNAYTHLIGDAVQGDRTWFVRWDSVKAAWQVVNELIHCKDECPIVHTYPIGSSGPNLTKNHE